MSIQPYFRTIDLTGVPVPDFVEAFSYQEIRSSAIAHLLELQPDYIVLESDPAIKVIEAFCYREMLLRQRINDGLRANTITLAQGADLETIGAFGSVPRLDNEEQERYRARVQQGFNRLAAAGPRGAYRAHVMGLSTEIVDVGIHSPANGEVVVTLLAFQDVDEATADEITLGEALFEQSQAARNGNQEAGSALGTTGNGKKRILCRASADIIARTRELLNEDDIRPLTDQVSVRPAHIIPFDVQAQLVIYPGPDVSLVVEQAKERLNDYLRSLRKVGYDATRSGLIAALSVGGVQNVILTHPAQDVVCGFYDVAAALNIDVEVNHVDI